MHSGGVLSGLFFFSSRRRHTRCSRDWSSDVCSSDLKTSEIASRGNVSLARYSKEGGKNAQALAQLAQALRQIGRASCRERVEISVVAGGFNRKHVSCEDEYRAVWRVSETDGHLTAAG